MTIGAQPCLSTCIIITAELYAIYCKALTVKLWYLQIIVHDTSTKDTDLGPHHMWVLHQDSSAVNGIKGRDKCLYKTLRLRRRTVLVSWSYRQTPTVGNVLMIDHNLSRVCLPSQEAPICPEIWRTAQNHVPARRSVFPFSDSCSPAPFRCMPWKFPVKDTARQFPIVDLGTNIQKTTDMGGNHGRVPLVPEQTTGIVLNW